MDRNTLIVSQEESLLTPGEAWQDYQSLKIALTEETGRPDARQWLELLPISQSWCGNSLLPAYARMSVT